MLDHRTAWSFWCLAGLLAVSSFVCTLAQQQATDAPVPRRALVNTYCLSCHNDRKKRHSMTCALVLPSNGTTETPVRTGRSTRSAMENVNRSSQKPLAGHGVSGCGGIELFRSRPQETAAPSSSGWSCPPRLERRSSMREFEQSSLVVGAGDLWSQATKAQFLSAIRDGNLPREAFSRWLVRYWGGHR